MEPPTRRSSQRLQSRQQNPPIAGRRTKRTIEPSTKCKTPVFTSSGSDQEAQSKRRKRPQRKRTKVSLPVVPLDPKNDPSPDETKPAKIRQPISGLIHPTLKSSWAINNAVDMCFIFDAVSPARQFKRGVEFNERGKFPEYNDRAPGDVTETDMVGPPGLMPYMPRDSTYVPHLLANWFT